MWQGEDSRKTPEGVITALLNLEQVLVDLKAVITGDHEVLRAISGVKSAGTKTHSHLVCANCDTTKGDVLDGDPFKVWKEKLHDTDLLPPCHRAPKGRVPLARHPDCGVTASELHL